MSAAGGRARGRRRQAGVTIVEFALVALLFFMILLGVAEFGRWLFTLNAAAEATRWGARLAAVCGTNQAAIENHVRIMLRSGNANLIVPPLTSCNSTGDMITVRLVGATFTPLIPFFGEPVSLPEFTTTVPCEALGSVVEFGSPVRADVCPAP